MNSPSTSEPMSDGPLSAEQVLQGASTVDMTVAQRDRGVGLLPLGPGERPVFKLEPAIVDEIKAWANDRNGSAGHLLREAAVRTQAEVLERLLAVGLLDWLDAPDEKKLGLLPSGDKLVVLDSSPKLLKRCAEWIATQLHSHLSTPSRRVSAGVVMTTAVVRGFVLCREDPQRLLGVSFDDERFQRAEARLLGDVSSGRVPLRKDAAQRFAGEQVPSRANGATTSVVTAERRAPEPSGSRPEPKGSEPATEAPPSQTPGQIALERFLATPTAARLGIAPADVSGSFGSVVSGILGESDDWAHLVVDPHLALRLADEQEASRTRFAETLESAAELVAGADLDTFLNQGWQALEQITERIDAERRASKVAEYRLKRYRERLGDIPGPGADRDAWLGNLQTKVDVLVDRLALLQIAVELKAGPGHVVSALESMADALQEGRGDVPAHHEARVRDMATAYQNGLSPDLAKVGSARFEGLT